MCVLLASGPLLYIPLCGRFGFVSHTVWPIRCVDVQQKYDEAIEDASAALKLDPAYVKALMRRSQVLTRPLQLRYLMIRDFDFEHFLGTPGLHVTGVTSPLLERP